MENFNWSSFTRKIAINASLEILYKAWVNTTELEKWFLSNAELLNENKEIQPKDYWAKKGNTYAWNWFLYDITENGIYSGTNNENHIQFSFAGNCLVDIKLSTSDGFTIVELTQSNIPLDENSKKNIRLGCDAGWSFYLVNLKSFYEHGIDLRNKNPNHKGMLNG